MKMLLMVFAIWAILPLTAMAQSEPSAIDLQTYGDRDSGGAFVTGHIGRDEVTLFEWSDRTMGRVGNHDVDVNGPVDVGISGDQAVILLRDRHDEDRREDDRAWDQLLLQPPPDPR